MHSYYGEGEKTNLESILSREALIAVSTWEWLNRKVNTLVSFQIVVAVETLRALITFERSIIMRLRLGRMWRAVHGHTGCMTTVEAASHYAMRKSTNEHRLAIRVVEIR